MTILHICSLDLDQANGVTVIVPQYAKEQSVSEQVIMLNLDEAGYDTTDYPVEHGAHKFASILQNHTIDIVVFHGIYYMQYISMYKTLKKKGIPYVIVPHCSLCDTAQKQKKIPKIILNQLFFHSFIRNSAAVQYLSEKEKTDSARFLAPSFISPNGVYRVEEKWKKTTRKQFKLVYIGRYAMYQKGLDLMIEACSICREYMLENAIVLELYGTDFENNKEQLVALIDEKKLSQIEHVNEAVFGEKKIAALLDADCFLQTSRFEGQPVAILEALSYGVIPIVTKGTTFAEQVEEKQCGFHAGDSPETIADAIKKAYENRESAEQFSKRAVNFVMEQYEWSAVTKRLLEQYRCIIEKNAGER